MDALRDRVVIVTGASGGIGAAAAEALAAAGARVVLAARRPEALEKVCERICQAGGTALSVPTDMRNEQSVEHLIDTALETYGALDALVNNAAVGMVRTIADGRTEEWRTMIETNLLGTLFACRAALRPMLARGAGDILNVTSAAAYEAWPYLAVYAATKAAVHALSQGLRAEVADKGIRVMTLEVHNVSGTGFAGSFDPAVAKEAVTQWEQRGLLRRASGMLQPQDAARAIVFQLAQPNPASVHHLSLRARAN